MEATHNENTNEVTFCGEIIGQVWFNNRSSKWVWTTGEGVVQSQMTKNLAILALVDAYKSSKDMFRYCKDDVRK